MTKTPQTSSLSQHLTNTGNDLPAEGSGDCVWYEHLSQHLHAEKRNWSVSYRAHRNPQNLTSAGSAHSRGAVRRVCGAGPVLLGFT